MKRRSILGSLGLAGIPGLGHGATSLYGTPVSVSGPLQQMLETIRLPVETLPLLMRFGQVWEKVLGNEADKQRFQDNAAGFLEQQGMPRSVLDARDPEMLLLKALTDVDILQSAMSGNYLDFLRRLKAIGFSSQMGKSGLKKQVLAVLQANLSEIKSKMPRISINADPVTSAYAESRELAYLYGQLAPSIDQVAVAAIPVAIAAIVVIYVSVAAMVTVGILAGVYISIAVMLAVMVGPNNCADETYDALFAGPAEMPEHGHTERQRRAQHAIAQRELLGKRMLVLGPERLKEAQQAVRLARLLNHGKFVLEANRQLLRDEVSVFLEASEEVGLLQIPKETRAEVVIAIQNIALRAAALE